MKIFHFDVTTGKRGGYIETSPNAVSIGNPEGAWTALPPNLYDTNWNVATSAVSRIGMPLKWDYPVCFCTGQSLRGSTMTWDWYVLLPAAKK